MEHLLYLPENVYNCKNQSTFFQKNVLENGLKKLKLNIITNIYSSLSSNSNIFVTFKFLYIRSLNFSTSLNMRSGTNAHFSSKFTKPCGSVASKLFKTDVAKS